VENITPRRGPIVEGEVMAAMMIGGMLADQHCEAAATVAHLDEAVQFARTAAFDLAILDVNLAGQATCAVAEALRDRRIPFVFATGYGAFLIDDPFSRRTSTGSSDLSSGAAIRRARLDV
jgi:two-component SAPR family response regulator